ncbi:MAG: hypothetical protein MJZ34_13750 [Paludibacteraceae bacterium]|nr:hypothetical protein [Paludibacteraceae bacterium]
MDSCLQTLVNFGNSLLTEDLKKHGFQFIIWNEDVEPTIYLMWADEILADLQDPDENFLSNVVQQLEKEFEAARNNKFLDFEPRGYCPIFY